MRADDPPVVAVVLSSCGWRTVTTKDRLNSFLPGLAVVVQQAGDWYHGTYGDGYYDRSLPWTGSAIFAPDGTVAWRGGEYDRPAW